MILETSGAIWSDLGKFWSTQFPCVYSDVSRLEPDSIHFLHITNHNHHVDHQKHDHHPVHYISEKMEGGGSFVGSGDMEFFQNGTSRDGTESG